jgi:hypothetical protein
MTVPWPPAPPGKTSMAGGLSAERLEQLAHSPDPLIRDVAARMLVVRGEAAAFCGSRAELSEQERDALRERAAREIEELSAMCRGKRDPRLAGYGD